MSALLSYLALSLRTRWRRIAGLFAFGLVFLLAAATTRVFTAGDEGHMELETLFQIGGTTLVSAVLLLGWLVGRVPLIATLVLLSGVFSANRAAGHARLFAVRPQSLVLLYGAEVLMYCTIAFLLSAIFLPGFDLLILGEWGGSAVFALIVAQIMVFGPLTALLSVITRADAWIALFLGMLAIVWDALRRADFFQTSAPVIRETVSVLLPPQGALMRVEAAFGASQPVPMDALLYIALYAALALVLAGVALTRREI